MKFNPPPVCLVICVLSLTTAAQPDFPVLYFSNLSNIQYYNETGNNTRVVFDNVGYGESIECNLCDHMIYWIELPGKIKRGDPNNLSTVETIISSDVHNPRGLAVDWISNNVYFSHIRTRGHGRIEVAKCDGSHRRVLRHDLVNVNVLAVNPITGHLYFSDVFETIRRIDLDGSNLETVYQRFFVSGVSGIALDYSLNHLYWALNTNVSQVVKYLDMDAWDFAYRRMLVLPTPVEVTVGSNPYEITIINSILYWTVLRQGLRAGAIYSRHMETNVTTKLINSHELSPHDLCSFYDSVHASSSGCAVNNGGCEIFCFSVPDPESNGTRVKCDCPTGIIINNDNQTCNSFPVNYLIFTQVHNDENSFEVDRTDIRMISLDISGQYIDVLVPIELVGTETVFVAYDVLYHRVYWTELDPPSIMSAFILDGSDVRSFINSSISHPESLVIDSFARNLYWIDSGLDRIEVVRLDNGYARKVLFDTDLVQPQGLALDVVRGYMYWTDLDSHTPRVERARMDGSERMVLPGVAGTSIKQPSNVAVDPLTRHVYWSDVFDDFERIVKYSEGQERELGLSGLEDVLGLAVHGSHIYWTDRGNIGYSLARADKISGQSKEALISNIGGFHGLIAVNQSIFPEASGCTSTHVILAENQLCLPNGNPMPNITCIDNYILNSGECEDTPPFLFFATERKVTEAQDFPDSSGFEQWRPVQEFDIHDVSALDVDISENKLYWINSIKKRIYRLSIRESGAESECIVCCCLSSPEDIAVDWFGRNLYWTDSDLHTIEIAKLDGSERTIFATIPRNMGGPSLIEVDPIRGDLYWSPKSGPVIYQMRMDDLSDDSNVRIRTFWEDSSNWTVVGISVNYTNSGGCDYIYWAVSDQRNTRRFEKRLCDNQGSSMDSQSAFNVVDMEIFGDHIYYIHDTMIIDQIRNDDTSADLFYSPVFGSGFTDMVFLHHSLQPGIHECSVNNRGCGGNSLCLVTDGVTGVCSCPTLLVTKQGQRRGTPFHDCIAVDTFLLLATNDSISYLPVPVDGSGASASPRRLPIGSVGSIRAIAYDPANKSVLWLDSEADNIQSVAVDGSNKWIFSAPPGLETFSMAYDWFGGQLFVTEKSGFQIDLVTLNGDNIGSLLKFPENPLMLNKPGEVVFDDTNSNLYWTSRSAIDGYGNAIHKLNLKNLNDINTLNIGSRKIEKLVLDRPFFYWISRGESDDAVIERCPINTTSSKLESEVVEVARGANNIAALTAMMINNQSNAFWYNVTDSFIYRYNGTTVVTYMEWRASGAITEILGYTRRDLLQARPCLTVPRPCSHMCLRSTLDGYECSCPPSSNLQDDRSTCANHTCDRLQLSCNDGFNGCYPRAYRCDGTTHCSNGADEANCSCNAEEEFTCFNSSECIPRRGRCDGEPECSQLEDELFCCQEPLFGCYVDASDRFDALGGNANRHYYKCLDEISICDNSVDCVDGSDEINCKDRPTTNTAEPSSGQLPAITLIVIIVSVVVVIVMVVLLVGVCVTVRWVHKKKQEYNMTQTMMQATNLSMGGIKGYSPPVRTDSQSDYCSEMSGGTHTTHVGNGSNMSPSGEVCFKYRTADPPPPSPDALTEIEDDDLSRLSQPISEYTVPVPPCPSINYDALSGNMSFSVSQSQFPGTIASHYNNGMYNRVGVNGRSLGGNLPNPLLMHQQNGSAYYHNTRAPPPHHIYVQTTKNMPTGNGTSKYEQRYPQSSRYHQSVYSRKELDSEAQSETESTLSMNIENPPGVFDENLPRPPPGRPPSPATLCSEYPAAQLMMSPETGSTLSDSSDEC